MHWLWISVVGLLAYGVGQGLVKKWIAEVPPARFCLFFVVVKACVNLGYFFSQSHPPIATDGGLAFAIAGIGAYFLDGTGWIFYFLSIVQGPISIVGTLSAAYPALTVLFARVFLSEQLLTVQYLGVFAVILGCVGLAWDNSSSAKKRGKQWVLFAVAALLLWSVAQTVVKWSYSLPQASDVSLALFNTLGGLITLGVFGVWGELRGRTNRPHPDSRTALSEWTRSVLPMGLLALGDLCVLVASQSGPISIVTPLTGAYPVVTLVFSGWILRERILRIQWVFIGLILAGVYVSTSVAAS